MLFTDPLESLDAISKFEHNWNGNNAEPFSKDLIDRTRDIVQKLSKQPLVFPTAIGCIELEYTRNIPNSIRNIYLIFEVYSDHIYVQNYTITKKETEKIIHTVEEMNEEIENFYNLSFVIQSSDS